MYLCISSFFRSSALQTQGFWAHRCLYTANSGQSVKLVVRELHYPAGLAATVAQHTGATLVELPTMVGGVPEAKDYLSFINYNVQTMLKAAATIKAAQN
jgi:hypothetical protein